MADASSTTPSAPRGRGKADGSLHEVPAVDLSVATLNALRERNGLDPILVEDVVLGCVDPVGEAGGDIARAAVLKAGFGKEVPGIQINGLRLGLDAVNLAAAQVMTGMKDVTIGGGVESMSRVGMGSSGGAWPADPGSPFPAISCRKASRRISSRRNTASAATTSMLMRSSPQRRAGRAWDEGRFKKSVIP